jgi:DNA-binding transcriptional ArsR family regulator
MIRPASVCMNGGRVEARIEPQSPHEPTRETVRVLAALSDVNRYRIVELLAESDELSCGAIGGALGLSPSLISHHLGVLEGAAVIQRRRDGLWTLNRLRRDELARRLSGLQRIVATPG